MNDVKTDGAVQPEQITQPEQQPPAVEPTQYDETDLFHALRQQYNALRAKYQTTDLGMQILYIRASVASLNPDLPGNPHLTDDELRLMESISPNCLVAATLIGHRVI